MILTNSRAQNNIATELQGFCKELHTIISDTEKGFGSFSSGLQAHYYQTNSISELSTEASRIISGELISQSIDNINNTLKKIACYLSDSNHQITVGKEGLDSILMALSKALDELPGFKRIVKHLRMLGISTKIENARLNIENSGFNVLAENVELLSSVIHDKTTGIKENSSSLIGQIRTVNSRIKVLQNKQREQSEAILNRISESLSWLQTKYSTSAEKAQQISMNSSVIAQSVSGIVMNVQFHDITRQQIEHVIDALGELYKLLADKGHDNEEVKNAIAGISFLQAAQLENTQSELDTALNIIINNLTEVQSSIDNIKTTTAELLLDVAKDNKESFLLQIENSLVAVTDALEQNSELRSEFSSSIRSVTTTVQKLASLINQIDEIGSEIEIIAMNARIKAARTGIEGAALDVLAEEIQHLSKEAKLLTSAVISSLDIVNNASFELQEKTGDSYVHGNTEMTSLIASISQVLASMMTVEKESNHIMEKVKSESSSLKNNIDAEISHLDIQLNAVSRIGEICIQLKEIASKYKGSSSNFVHDERIKKLLTNYTMQSERKIHDNLSAQKVARDHKINKNFNRTETEYFNTDSDDLGENVELF